MSPAIPRRSACDEELRSQCLASSRGSPRHGVDDALHQREVVDRGDDRGTRLAADRGTAGEQVPGGGRHRPSSTSPASALTPSGSERRSWSARRTGITESTRTWTPSSGLHARRSPRPRRSSSNDGGSTPRTPPTTAQNVICIWSPDASMPSTRKSIVILPMSVATPSSESVGRSPSDAEVLLRGAPSRRPRSRTRSSRRRRSLAVSSSRSIGVWFPVHRGTDQHRGA